MDSKAITFLKEKYLEGEPAALISLNLIISGLTSQEAVALIKNWKNEKDNNTDSTNSVSADEHLSNHS